MTIGVQNFSVPPSNRISQPSGSALEFKEDFGRLVRRIMYSNSGKFRALPCGEAPPEPPKKMFSVQNPKWTFLKESAESAAQHGRYKESEGFWLNALDEARQFNERDPRLAATLESLASLCYAQGRFDQAEEYGLQVMEATINAYGYYHSSVASCLNNLAGIYYNQGRYNDAELPAGRALHIYERLYGTNHPDVGMAVNNLAMLLHAQDKFEEAEALYRKAYLIRSKALGNDHPCVITLLENLAALLKATGKIDQAEQVGSTARGSGFRFKAVQPPAVAVL